MRSGQREGTLEQSGRGARVTAPDGAPAGEPEPLAGGKLDFGVGAA